ncbi:MAG: YchJ family protein [Thermodesulfobacteriota bacterium]
MTKKTPCPCGTGLSYGACCQPFVELGQLPPTAEALMRSRYSAFTLANAAYLLNSWHPTTAPKDLNLKGSANWCRLEILASTEGSENDDRGVVEFKAHYMSQGTSGSLHEVSRFVKEGGRWFYVDGEIQGSDGEAKKVGRNDPCPCGRARKFKKCCMA